MSKQLSPEWPVAALTRVLDALEVDLLKASDEEVLAAAKELGMNPEMRGSAAFQGLKFPAKPKISDFFNLEAWNAGNADRTVSLRPPDGTTQRIEPRKLPPPSPRKTTSNK